MSKISEFKALTALPPTEHSFMGLKFKVKGRLDVTESMYVFDSILSFFYSINSETDAVEKDDYISGSKLDIFIDYYAIKTWTDIALPGKKVEDGSKEDDVLYIVNQARKTGLAEELYNMSCICNWATQMRNDIVVAYNQLMKQEQSFDIADFDFKEEDISKLSEQLGELKKLPNMDVIQEVVKSKNEKALELNNL